MVVIGEGDAGEANVGYGCADGEEAGFVGEGFDGGVCDVEEDAVVGDDGAGEAEGEGGIGDAIGGGVCFEGGEHFIGGGSGVDAVGAGCGGDEGELDGGGAAFEVGDGVADGVDGVVFEDLHGGGGIEDDGDALDGVLFVEAWLREEPCEEECGEDLHPEGDGGDEAFEAAAGGGFALGAVEEEECGDGDGDGFPLEEVDGEDGGNREEGEETERVGEHGVGGVLRSWVWGSSPGWWWNY